LRRAVVIGAGSFGTAVAILLARGGLRTTLQARTSDQARQLEGERENRVYLPGVPLPVELRIESVEAGLGRADYVFLGVPSWAQGELIDALPSLGLPRRAAIVSLAKGLVPPDGAVPTMLLSEKFGAARVACLGGPAHAREMVHAGAGLVAASTDEALARALAQAFTRGGVVCELSDDPSSPAPPRTPRRWRRALPRRRDSTRRAPPPATSSPRSGALPSSTAPGRSR
jgi:glycerol-3-phosphate dehydrogenase (NAD(P)+)